MGNNLGKYSSALPINVSVEDCMKDYFQKIDNELSKRESFSETNGSLDYLLMKRFLETMFNNMREMDHNFVAKDLAVIHRDLKDMSSVYDDYQSQVAFPELAFEKVFLSKQAAYMSLKSENDTLKEEVDLMSVEEKSIRAQIEHKVSVLDQMQRATLQYSEIAKDIRQLKGKYSDIVHKVAVKKEQMQKNLDKLYEFEDLYKAHFKKLFNAESKKYRDALISILNAQAYVFDFTLWEHAKASKPIQAYFLKAQIKGDFSSLTYLKYYLTSLNDAKFSEEQAQMKKLYDYLSEKSKMYVLVIRHDLDDALQMKANLSTCKLDIGVEVFVDEVKSIKWAKQHRVGLLVLDEKLQKLNAQQYIAAYKSRISPYVQSLVLTSLSKEKLDATATLPVRHTKSEFVKCIQSLVE